MQEQRKRQLKIIAAYLCLLVLGVALRQLNRNTTGVLYFVIALVQTVIFAGLLVAWIVSVRQRITQASVRKCLASIGVLSLVWLLTRSAKFYIFTDATVSRYLWYLYYLPLLFIPVLLILSAVSIGKNDQYKFPRALGVLFYIATPLFALVMTNDLHQLVFRFGSVPFSDSDYTYGILYYPVALWFYVSSIVTLFILIRKCRIPRSKHAVILPILPLLAGILYNIAYVFGKVQFYPDFTVVTCCSIILTYETCIQVGLIRANTRYESIFDASSISAQIIDSDRRVVYGEDKLPALTTDKLDELLQSHTLIYGDVKLSASEISGGYVLWQEDVSELLDLHEQFEDSNERLEGQATALNEKYRTTLKRQRIEEQNRLYNEMQNQTAGKLELLSLLMDESEDATGEDERRYLLKISTVTAYLKRRNNLIFLSKENSKLSASELQNCIVESVRNLATFGIEADIHFSVSRPLTLTETVSVYDALEEIIEATAEYHPAYFISVTEKDGQTVLGVRLTGITELPPITLDNMTADKEDDAEYILTV